MFSLIIPCYNEIDNLKFYKTLLLSILNKIHKMK